MLVARKISKGVRLDDHAKLVEVIRVLSTIGKGVDDDPVRAAVDFYTLEGVRIAHIDSWKEQAKKPFFDFNDFVL